METTATPPRPVSGRPPLATDAARPRGPAAAQERLRPDSLASSLLIMLGVSATQRVVGLLRSLLVCHWLSPSQLGQWELSMSFLLLAAPLVVLGLPGAFGRYVEAYRLRGQLQTFLLRTATWTILLAAAAAVAACMAAHRLSQLLFGNPDEIVLVRCLAVCLLTIIVHHYLEALLAGLRMFRIVSCVQFLQSVVFAVLALVLLAVWAPRASSVVMAYAAACAIASSAAIAWLALRRGEFAAAGPPPSHREFWSRLLGFAVWVWVINLIGNLFAVADRYMIVHWSAGGEALADVGQYHASRMVPVLVVSVSELLAVLVLPYLSRDWEEGRRSDVSRRVVLALKLTSCVMLAASAVIVVAAPWLIERLFPGKYSAGLSLMPWTLAYCSLWGLLSVAQNYLWCAERVRLAAVPLVAGLAANVAINAALLPVWGLVGAVVATTLANLTAVFLTVAISRMNGLQTDASLWLLLCLPMVIALGPLPMLVALTLTAAALYRGGWLLNRWEKNQLADVFLDVSRKFRRCGRCAGAVST